MSILLYQGNKALSMCSMLEPQWRRSLMNRQPVLLTVLLVVIYLDISHVVYSFSALAFTSNSRKNFSRASTLQIKIMEQKQQESKDMINNGADALKSTCSPVSNAGEYQHSNLELLNIEELFANIFSAENDRHPRIYRSNHEDYEMYLELSPIIGGPKFLPIHMTVVLEETNPKSAITERSPLNKQIPFRRHKFDFIPINATNIETMNQLLRLQSVPGEIRFKTSSQILQNDNLYFCNSLPSRQQRYLQQTWIDSDEQSLEASHHGDSKLELETDTFDEVGINSRIEEAIQKAQEFCLNYSSKQLHLVSNNCYTFATQLYTELLKSEIDSSRYK